MWKKTKRIRIERGNIFRNRSSGQGGSHVHNACMSSKYYLGKSTAGSIEFSSSLRLVMLFSCSLDFDG